MKQPTLKAKLQALGEAVNEVTDSTLNYGGCCVYAALVARELEKMGIPVKGVVRSYGPGNVDHARTNVAKIGDPNAWNREGIYFNHVGLEAKINGRKYLFDSERIQPAKAKTLGYGAEPICDGRLSVDELEKLAGLGKHETKPKKGWNARFNRELIPTVRAVVSKLGEEVTYDEA
jgi:hypothetical protein